MLAQRELFSKAEPEYHGELIDFDSVWFEPKPLQINGPPIILGVMGPLGVRHAAQWADGWMPVDVAMPDIEQAIKDFRRQVSDFGRDPDAVEITMVAMGEITTDLLKRYQDMGIAWVNIGVGMENWDKPEIVMPMIEEFSKLIPSL